MTRWVVRQNSVLEVGCELRDVGENRNAYVTWKDRGKSEISTQHFDTETEALNRAIEILEVDVQRFRTRLKEIKLADV